MLQRKKSPQTSNDIQRDKFGHNKISLPNIVFLFGRPVIIKIADNLETPKLSALRLTVYIGSCVFASGSLITVILNCFAFIKVSFLHFGQNKGKFFNSVSLRSFVLVLLLHIGHNTHSLFSFCIYFTSTSYSVTRFYAGYSCI